MSDLLLRYPDNLDGLEQLASVLSDAGNTERLQVVVARLREIAPTSRSLITRGIASFPAGSTRFGGA